MKLESNPMCVMRGASSAHVAVCKHMAHPTHKYDNNVFCLMPKRKWVGVKRKIFSFRPFQSLFSLIAYGVWSELLRSYELCVG